MALGMGNNGNGGNWWTDIQIGMPTLGAGSTGVDIGTSELGPVGALKTIVIDDVYSENGSVLLRSTDNYIPGAGGAEDIFRDFLGKVWAQSQFMGTTTKIEFINTKMGDGSSIPNLNVPCDVYVDNAQLADDNIWPEYVQRVYIDPDLNWLYDKIVPTLFPDQDFSPDVRGVVIQFLQNPLKQFVGVDSNTIQVANEIVAAIYGWWQTVFQFETGPTEPPTGIQSPLIQFGPSYEDYNFVIATPYSVEDASKMAGLKPLIMDLKTVYNFYVKNYECLLSDAKIKEPLIPNIYAFISAFLPEKKGTQLHHTSKKFEDLVSLNNLLQGYDPSSLVNNSPVNFNGTLTPAAANSYYQAWATTIKNATEEQLAVLDPLAKRYTNTLFPMNDVNMLKYYNKYRFMFPMYNSLKFSTGVLTKFGDIMRSTKLAQRFMFYYLVNEYTDSPDWDPDVKKKENVFIQESRPQLAELAGEAPTMWEIDAAAATEVQVMSLEGWLQKMELYDALGQEDELGVDVSVGGDSKTFFDENAVFMSTNKNEDLINVETSNKLERSIFGLIFLGKARKIAKSHLRHYGDLLKGETAYSETLMYKVDKFVDIEKNENRVQTFYFLNSSEIDVLNFIDTQVSYNVRYTYKITAVQLVLGTEYRYHEKPFWASDVQTSMPGGPFNPYADMSADDAAEAQALKEAAAAGEPELSVFQDQQNMYLLGCKEGALTPPGLTPPGNPYFGLTDPCGCADILIKYNLFRSAEMECQEKGPDSPCCAKVGPTTDTNIPPSNAGQGTPGVGTITETGTGLLTSIPVVYKPKYNIMEVPYATVEGRILDKPPVFPDVNLVPYKGINNKLLVSLNSSVGEYDMMPVAFNGEEEDEISLMREAQKIADKTKPIKFKSDDTVAYGGFFQIYRMEKKPKSYKDFDKHLHQTVRTNVSDTFPLWAESASIADDIEPNKKYYYTFRTVDVHGNSSNPTDVFEIEMIDDNGTIYFRQRIVEFDPLDKKVPSKSMRKYVQIRPTLAQRVLDEADLELSGAETAFEYSMLEGTRGPLSLGMRPESVWGKKFKIRFTSKSTGKQFDLNINFKVTPRELIEYLANQMKNTAIVGGIQAAGGGIIDPVDMKKSGEPVKPLEGL